jgi:hypothetical protein
VSVYNKECESFYPVTHAIDLLTSIIKINDIQGGPDLRRKFMANDGLKHLYGVSVMDDQGSKNPDDLIKKSKPNAFLLGQF